MARRLTAPSLAFALSVAGCVLDNPEYSLESTGSNGTSEWATAASSGDGSGGQLSSTGVLSGGGSDSDWGSSSSGALTIDGVGSTSASSTDSTTDATTTTGDTDTSDATDTGDAPAFPKMTLRNYNPDTCNRLLACTDQQGYLVPATQVDTECFTPAVDGPLYVSRVGVNVSYRLKSSPLVVDFYAYDPVAKGPTGGVVASHAGANIAATGYHEVLLDPPVMFAEPAFCAALRTGDNDSQVVVPIDIKTPGGGLSFFEMNAGVGCTAPRSPLESYFKTGNGHWCVNVDIQPTP